MAGIIERALSEPQLDVGLCLGGRGRGEIRNRIVAGIKPVLVGLLQPRDRLACARACCGTLGPQRRVVAVLVERLDRGALFLAIEIFGALGRDQIAQRFAEGIERGNGGFGRRGRRLCLGGVRIGRGRRGRLGLACFRFGRFALCCLGCRCRRSRGPGFCTFRFCRLSGSRFCSLDGLVLRAGCGLDRIELDVGRGGRRHERGIGHGNCGADGCFRRRLGMGERYGPCEQKRRCYGCQHAIVTAAASREVMHYRVP